VASIIDAFIHRITGYRVKSSMCTDLVLATREQVLWSRLDIERPYHYGDRAASI
jgi:hypothetical protein